jgi:hypothetical protein
VSTRSLAGEGMDAVMQLKDNVAVSTTVRPGADCGGGQSFAHFWRANIAHNVGDSGVSRRRAKTWVCASNNSRSEDKVVEVV